MIYVNARFVTQPLTGVQRYAFEVCLQLKNMDPGIVFLSPANVVHHEWVQILAVKKIGLLKGHLWEQIELPIYLKRQKKAILFSPCNTGPLFFNRQLLSLHDVAFKIFPQFNSNLFQVWYNFLVPRLCKKALHIFTVSQTVKKEICTYYAVRESKISVTFNGVSAAMIEAASVVVEKEKMILSIGSLNKRKNIEFLIEAFLSSQLVSHYKLVIIGKPNDIYSQSNLRNHPQIEIIENATDSQLVSYYQRAELACFLSVYEGFGIPVLESLQFACKLICADIPVFRELYEGAVYFCNPTKEQDLIEMLNQISSMSATSKEKVLDLNQKYNYFQSAQHILKLIRQS